MILVVALLVALAIILIWFFLIRPPPKDEIMATVQELQDATATLNAAVNRAIPILRDAGTRIDPAALDPVRDSLVTTAQALNDVLPPG